MHSYSLIDSGTRNTHGVLEHAHTLNVNGGKLSFAFNFSIPNAHLLNLLSEQAYAKVINGFPSVFNLHQPFLAEGLSPTLPSLTYQEMLENAINEAIASGIDPAQILEILPVTAAGTELVSDRSDYFILDPLYGMGSVSAGYPTTKESFSFSANDTTLQKTIFFTLTAETSQEEVSQAEVSIDSPTPTPSLVSQASLTTYEDALSSGNKESNTQTTSSTTDLNGLFGSTPNVTLSFNLNNDTSSLPSLTSHGEPIQYTVRDNVLTAEANGQPIFTLTLNNDNTLTMILQGPIDQPQDNTESSRLDISSLINVSTSNGDPITLPANTVVIEIQDDVPTAHPDAFNVSEGASFSSTVLSNDIAGADSYAAAGGVIGVRAAGSDTISDVSTGVDTPINGAYGTLTLHADGSYEYQSNANALAGAA
ncbi:structural toxin protein RtxA, partial [Legionella santicrucis]